MITEGSKHLSIGNEDYGFEDNGHISRCLKKRGWISKFDQPSRVVQNAKGEDVTITAPPMVAVLKSAPPHFYEQHRLDPNWAGQIKVIGSKLFLHSDFGRAQNDTWVLGTTVFEISMPHVNFDADGVIGYYTCGKEIRATDLRRWGLRRDQFTQLTTAAYNMLCVQAVHLNSYYGNKRMTARRALRAAYAYGIALGASIICGDFNGAAYRSSTDSQANLSTEDEVYHSMSPMAVEEFQFLVDSLNNGVPLEQRVGLQFRNTNSLGATDFRPSLGEQNAIHSAIPRKTLDTMLMMHVSLPVFTQHEPYRKDYQLTTVREVRAGGSQCKDDGRDLPSNYFPVPLQMMRSDLVLEVNNRSLFRMDLDASSSRSCKRLSNSGVLKRVPQQYGNDHLHHHHHHHHHQGIDQLRKMLRGQGS